MADGIISGRHKQLVQESCQLLGEMPGPLSRLFYGRLFQLDPGLRPMFRQDIALQGRKLMDMLTAIVGTLNEPDKIAPVLRAMGQRHAGYGVLPHHYQTVSRALIWALGQALDRDFDTEVRAAWTSTVDFICTGMLAGAAELSGSTDSLENPRP